MTLAYAFSLSFALGWAPNLEPYKVGKGAGLASFTVDQRDQATDVDLLMQTAWGEWGMRR